MVAKEQLALGGVYSALGGTLALLARTHVLPPAAASVLLSLLWLGFVLAISFLEAWVKFRAPFLPRHLGLDVGRTVFAALNAVEIAFCAGLWFVQLVGAPSLSAPDGVLVTLTVVLGTQFAILYPKLELNGEFVLYDALKNERDESLTFHQKTVFSEIRKNVKTNVKPSPAYHVAYVLGEVVKAVLLATFALQILTRLPQ